MAEREVHIWMDKIGFDEFENTAYLCTTYAETRVMRSRRLFIQHRHIFASLSLAEFLYTRMVKCMKLRKVNVKEQSVKFDRHIILKRC